MNTTTNKDTKHRNTIMNTTITWKKDNTHQQTKQGKQRDTKQNKGNNRWEQTSFYINKTQDKHIHAHTTSLNKAQRKTHTQGETQHKQNTHTRIEKPTK